MSADVVRLSGKPAPLENRAEPEVIAVLEAALASAKLGEIIAIGLIFLEPNGVVRTKTRCDGYKHQIVAGCEYLKLDLAEK